MRGIGGAVAGIGVLSSVANAAWGQATILEPSSGWVLDYADERCSLNRKFGSELAIVTLQVNSYGSSSDFHIILAGSALPQSNEPVTKIQYRLSADKIEREVTSLNGTFGNDGAVSFEGSFRPYEPERDSEKEPIEQRLALNAVVEPPDPQFEQQIQTMTIGFEKGTRIDLHLGGMMKPLEALRQCIDNLKEGWQLDAAREHGLARRALPDMRSVRRLQQSYPPSMIRAGVNAYVPVRIMVDEQGQAGACVVQISSVEADFAKAVCDRLARRYSPALDSAGKPVASVFVTGVVFILQ